MLLEGRPHVGNRRLDDGERPFLCAGLKRERGNHDDANGNSSFQWHFSTSAPVHRAPCEPY
jgi:hypothetical protein